MSDRIENDGFVFDVGDSSGNANETANNSGSTAADNGGFVFEAAEEKKTGTEKEVLNNDAPVKSGIAPQNGSAAVADTSSGKNPGKVFNSDEVSAFCGQFAMLLHGGISLSEGTYMLYSDMEDAKTKAVLKILDEQVGKGVPFSKSLAATHAFPDYMIHMVEVGEKTGRLEYVMRSLSEYYERDSRIKSGIRSAVAYPMVLFGVMACIMIVLVWKILPMFEKMFDELSSDVSSATENVLTAGLAAGKVIAAVILILFVLVILVIIYGRTKSGSKFLAKLGGMIGPTRKLQVLMSTGKFISSMSLMMASGMDISTALDSEYENCENDTVKARIDKCRELYNKGSYIDEALRDSGLIVGMDSRLVSVAVKTGETDVVFTKLSEQYNEKTTAALGKMTTIIETTLVIVLSLMVGAVLLAVMMPLVSMISSIG